MKTKVTGAKFGSALGRVGQLFSRVVWWGAVILICSGASAQNMFVSGTNSVGGEVIFKFSWDLKQSIFGSGFSKPRDMALDSAGNPFFVDYEIVGGDFSAPASNPLSLRPGLQRAGVLCKEKDVCLELRELSAAKLTMS